MSAIPIHSQTFTIKSSLLVLTRGPLYDAEYPIERMVLPDNYMADDETKSAAANGNEYGICVEL